MTKNDVVINLIEQGYKAELVENIPVVSIEVKSQKDFNRKLKELKSVLSQQKYNDSFCVSYKKE